MWFQRYPVGQTDAQTHSSQYFTTASTGEVISAEDQRRVSHFHFYENLVAAKVRNAFLG